MSVGDVAVCTLCVGGFHRSLDGWCRALTVELLSAIRDGRYGVCIEKNEAAACRAFLFIVTGRTLEPLTNQ